MKSNVDLIERYWSACWNERDTTSLSEIFHDPYTHGKTQFTPELLGQIITETVRSFSDFHVTVDEAHEADDMVITRSTFSGTQDGDIFGLQATRKAIEMPSLDIFFFEQGKVRKYWHLTDHLPIIQGMGAEVRLGGRTATWG